MGKIQETNQSTAPHSQERCPACYSNTLDKPTPKKWTCKLCKLSGPEDVFRNWAHHKHQFLPVNGLLVLPNPGNWMSRFIGTAKSGGTIAYSAMAAEAILERHQIAITHYKTQGVFGLPLSLGRWGEKLYIKTSDHDTTAPETKGKITIGGICTTNDTIAIAHIIRLCLPMARHFVFVVDTYDRATATNFENELRQQLSEELTHDDNLKIGYNSLEQNFSRQRNIVQALAETPWVLQLDTDETLSPELVHQLGWTITKADNMNVPSVGIPRRNYVDGHLTAHYPDIQYRLNRKKVRYTQPVHETPDVAWYDKVYCWLGHIDHHLASARLQKRSATYEGIEKGAGKPQVLTLLQTPFSLPSI